MSRVAATLAVLFLLGGWTGAVAQELPGGATSLNETHGDWTVSCMTAEGAVRCATMQHQVSGENRQRVLSIQIAAAADGGAPEGVLVLPFGLRLDTGVRLAIDENAALPQRRFSTCLPAGCVVPLALDAETVMVIRAGTALRVTAIADDTGQEVAFSISLAGFPSALDRVTQLSGS